MDTFELLPAKLLYFVTELYKTSQISSEEKIKLKEMVVAENIKLIKFYEQYEQTNDLTELEN